MTKHDITENPLKYSANIEDSFRLTLEMNNLVEQNKVALCSHQAFAEEEPRLNVISSKNKSPKRTGLSRIAPQLSNLELDDSPEKPLNIELDLYQMEDY